MNDPNMGQMNDGLDELIEEGYVSEPEDAGEVIDDGTE